MNYLELKDLIKHGREIEFRYKNKNYSITYYNDEREKYISFCEFYKDTLDVTKVDELWESSYEGIKLSKMFQELKNEDIEIY